MKIVVLGAGVIGVCTAYYLRRAGHEVTVLDRQPGAGQETSFANAGQVSPGYSSPWAVPGMFRKLSHWLTMKHAPVVLHPTLDIATLRWSLAFLKNCNSAAYAVNKARMMRLSEYSQTCLQHLRRDTGLHYDERRQGTLQLYRRPDQLAKIAQDVAVLDRFGIRYTVLDRAGCVAAEPGLANANCPVAGGLRLLDDETGDCFLFTQRLAEQARRDGVLFYHDTTVRGFATEAGRITAVHTDAGAIDGDVFVSAFGSYTPLLLKQLGVRVPVIPLKGYSMTMPVIDAARAPRSTITDETYKVCVTRLGDRIRVAGTAEIAGYDAATSSAERRATLLNSYQDLFPDSGDPAQASHWACLRPMTPDNGPIVGGTPISNLFLNTGHGTLGWTMACGSGKLLADIISSRAPDIDPVDYRLGR